MASLRVLIVEDDFLVRLTLAEALSSDGFEVVEADSAAEALQMLEADPAIGLLMTDLQLGGGLNGQQLAAVARETRRELPVIYMTGRPDLVKLGDDSRQRVIPKPYLPSAICSAARELMTVS